MSSLFHFPQRLSYAAIGVALGLSNIAPSLAQEPSDTQLSSSDESEYERVQIRYHQPYRGNVTRHQLPQAIDALNRDLIEDTNINRYQDLLRFSPSVALQNDGGGLWDSYSLRGFPGNENMPSGYLINGFDGGCGFSGHRDISNIEFVEILKGPGSALYGRSDPGGIINITTRKPQYTPEGYIKVSAGNFDRQRIEADYTRGLSETVAARINGAWQDHGSFRDFVNSEKRVLTPSVRWQVTDNTALLYEFEYLSQSQLFDRGIVVLDNDINTVPRSRYLGEPDDKPTEVRATGHQLTFEHRLPANWYATGGISHRRSKLSGFSSDAELAPARQSLFQDGRTLTRQRRFRDYDSEDTSLRLELSGSQQWLGLEHNLLFGVDAYDYELYTLLARVRPPAGEYEIDIFAPQYGLGQQVPVPVPLYANFETQQAWATYVQNQFAITPRLSALVGLRLDNFEQTMQEQVSQVDTRRRDSRVSPRAGLTFAVTADLNVYASYSEGFLPLSGTDASGLSFDPEESDSVEIGFKWRGQGWQVNGAVFDATKTNILTSDPVNIGFPAPLGAANSRGFELDGAIQVGQFSELQLAYAYLDAATKNDVINLDWGTDILAGSRLINVPRHTLNMFARHTLDYLGLNANTGVRFRYVDSRIGDSVNPEFVLPSYTVFDVFYNHALNDALSVQVNVDNVFDRVYLSNSYSALWATPGAPRQYSVSLRYDF